MHKDILLIIYCLISTNSYLHHIREQYRICEQCYIPQVRTVSSDTTCYVRNTESSAPNNHRKKNLCDSAILSMSIGVREIIVLLTIIKVQYLSKETSFLKTQIHPVLSHTLKKKTF